MCSRMGSHPGGNPTGTNEGSPVHILQRPSEAAFGPQKGALRVSRKGYRERDRPGCFDTRGLGSPPHLPRHEGWFPDPLFLGTTDQGRARVCPEGLGPGSRGNSRSTPWTDLADTIRPSGTSDHPSRGNLGKMKRFRPTGLVFQGNPCEKDGVTRTRKQGSSRRMIQVIGEFPDEDLGAT
jgi:hypothetical protein